MSINFPLAMYNKYSSLPVLGQPKSFVRNLTDDGIQLSYNSTASNLERQRFTISFWTKQASTIDNVGNMFLGQFIDEDEYYSVFYAGEGEIGFDTEFYNGFQDTLWNHYVITVDTTNPVADDRIRFYKNGIFVPDSGNPPPQDYLIEGAFLDGGKLDIGYYSDVTGVPSNGTKFAFFRVISGVAILGTDTQLAFNNGGVWTQRYPYAPVNSGNYGCIIDGTDGINDVSGNNWPTIQNGTGLTLDPNDLPPFAA